MKVLLLRPPVRTPLTITPPLGIGFLAAALRKEGVRVKIFDGVRSGGGIDHVVSGYPGEDKEDVERTIAFSRRLPIDYCSFTAFVPYPGSEVFDELLTQGRVSLEDLPRADMYFVERSYSEYLTDEQIKKYRLRAYLGFFLRPRPLAHFMTEVRSLGHLKMIGRRIWVHIAHLGK